MTREENCLLDLLQSKHLRTLAARGALVGSSGGEKAALKIMAVIEENWCKLDDQARNEVDLWAGFCEHWPTMADRVMRHCKRGKPD